MVRFQGTNPYRDSVCGGAGGRFEGFLNEAVMKCTFYCAFHREKIFLVEGTNPTPEATSHRRKASKKTYFLSHSACQSIENQIGISCNWRISAPLRSSLFDDQLMRPERKKPAKAFEGFTEALRKGLSGIRFP